MPFDLTVDVPSDFAFVDVEIDPDDAPFEFAAVTNVNAVIVAPPLEDSVRMILDGIAKSSSRRNSVFASDLSEAEELLAVLDSSGSCDAEAVLQSDGQVLVSWRLE